MQDKNLSSGATRHRYNSPTTQKSLKVSNYVQQVTSFQPPTPCSQHYNDSLGYICIDCRFKCLCGTCLQEGMHKSHHVKNFDKGSKIIDRALNQALIRLRSKSDLLTNLKDYINIRKTQIFHQCKDYQQTFSTNFQIIFKQLAERQRQMQDYIFNYHQLIKQKLEILTEQINEQSMQTLDLITEVEDKVDRSKLNQALLCLYYQTKNVEIQDTVDSAGKNFQYFKNRTPDIKWNIDLQIFNVLRMQIRSLGLETSQQQIDFKCSFYENIKDQGKKPDSKHQKIKSSYVMGCRTPKNIQTNKISRFNFRSPSGATNKKSKGNLSSMPVSPSKDKTPKKKSLGKLKGEQANKKFKKNKK